MKFSFWLEQREKGKSLPEKGYNYSYVSIYRAVKKGINEIFPMDYVTLSVDFAKEHANHQTIVEEEPYAVIKATVPSKDVYEAYNPGEYFYDGKKVSGKAI